MSDEKQIDIDANIENVKYLINKKNLIRGCVKSPLLLFAVADAAASRAGGVVVVVIFFWVLISANTQCGISIYLCW